MSKELSVRMVFMNATAVFLSGASHTYVLFHDKHVFGLDRAVAHHKHAPERVDREGEFRVILTRYRSKKIRACDVIASARVERAAIASARVEEASHAGARRGCPRRRP